MVECDNESTESVNCTHKTTLAKRRLSTTTVVISEKGRQLPEKSYFFYWQGNGLVENAGLYW